MVSADSAFDTILDTVGQPIRSSSLFYTYYYLNEIEDVSEVAADLSVLENKLHDGFYYYGVMSVMKEVVHITRKTHIEIKGEDMSIRSALSKRRRRLQEILEEETPRDLSTEYVYSLLSIRESAIRMLSTNHEDVKNLLQFGEKNHNILSKPERFIRSAKFLFDGPLKWRDDFGGEQWASVCDVLLERDETTKTIWVDLCWSVEHNSGNWLNKINVKQDELEMARKITGYDVADVSDTGMDFVVQDEILEDILDAKREGNFGEIFPIARRYDSSLSRYRHLLA